MKRLLGLAAALSCIATHTHAANFDFEAPAFALGTTYGNPAGHVPGTVVFSQAGVDVSVETFHLGGFVGFNFAQIAGHPGPPTSYFPMPINPTQTLTINNINMNFDLTGSATSTRQVIFDYVDLGGGENLQINGFPRLELAKLKDAEFLAPPGFNIAVSQVAIPGGITGKVRITADPFNEIKRILVGGQEFGIDNFRTIVPGDADGDGDVDDADLANAFSNYTGPGGGGKTAADGDTDGDGDVDDADLASAFSNYTGPLAPGAAVPEPASLMLLGLGGLALTRRRRRA